MSMQYRNARPRHARGAAMLLVLIAIVAFPWLSLALL